MFMTGKTLEFECRSRKIMLHRLSSHWMLGTDVISGWKNSGYQEQQSKQISGVNKPLKTQLGPVHTSLFSSHHLVFPALVPVPMPFPHSGRHRSVPLALSALCSLAKQREVTTKMAKTPSPCGSSAMELAVINWADAAWSALRSPDRKSSHSDSCSRFVVIRYGLVNDASLTKTGWTPTALFCKWLWH